jgi:hypothetical protein
MVHEACWVRMKRKFSTQNKNFLKAGLLHLQLNVGWCSARMDRLLIEVRKLLVCGHFENYDGIKNKVCGVWGRKVDENEIYIPTKKKKNGSFPFQIEKS